MIFEVLVHWMAKFWDWDRGILRRKEKIKKKKRKRKGGTLLVVWCKAIMK